MAFKPTIASLDDVHDLARELSDPWLLCRLRRHRWEDYGKVVENRKYKTFEETVDCERCTATLVTLYRDDGEIITRRASYPEGYLLRGKGRIDARGRQMLQAERLARRRRRRLTAAS